jgi:hypothetical protein
MVVVLPLMCVRLCRLRKRFAGYAVIVTIKSMRVSARTAFVLEEALGLALGGKVVAVTVNEPPVVVVVAVIVPAALPLAALATLSRWFVSAFPRAGIGADMRIEPEGGKDRERDRGTTSAKWREVHGQASLQQCWTDLRL